MTEQRISVGGIPLPGASHVSLGRNHPVQVGVISIDLTIADGLISAADVRPGYLHRGAEKLFEVRDYRSLIMLADRHDWLASFSGELVVTLAVESALGLCAFLWSLRSGQYDDLQGAAERILDEDDT